ncbi:MAG: ImpA family metalloprotease, partial [Leucothrix sp.]
LGSESNGLGTIIDNISLVDSGKREVTPIEAALLSGDVSQVSEQALILATLEEIDAEKHAMADAKAQIFNLNADGSVKDDGSSLTLIDWNPTHDASTFTSTLGMNTGLLYTNATTQSGKTPYHKEIGIIGEKDAGRYIVLGGNPLRNAYRSAGAINDQMHQFMENSLAWLTDRKDLKTSAFNIVIAQMDDSHYFPDERATRAWLDEHYADQVTYNAIDSCDSVALSSCLNNNPDLLIISQISGSNDNNEALAATVDRALKAGTPVLYLHHDGNHKALGRTLFSEVFDVDYQWDNYWKKLSLSSYDATTNMGVLSDRLSNIQTLFQHFRDEDYSFDWSQCDKEDCRGVTGLDSEFQTAASSVKSMMNTLDSDKKAIFDTTNYRIQKLLALTADKFRENVTYPMDKTSSNDTEFMKSYYADHAVYNYRLINPAQTDMGNFSRSDFSHITPIDKTVNMESKEHFRSAGVYALPSQTVSITRHDASDLETKIFINTLRSGATHQFARNGYKRPKYLQSAAIEIKSGETINLTSPYGGPLQVRFSENDLPVSFTFKNVGEHAYWRGEADTASFEEKLAAAEYDWAEVVTPGFEVHSKLDKMRISILNDQWGSPQALATATMRYMHNFPHVLAGFQGPGIDVVPEIHDFAKANGWTIETLDKVKHMNADQASCGYGCSGNPYDAYWAYNPVGHGDVHELGHGLQGGRRFDGWQNHTMTNYYSYYTKSQHHKDTGANPECQGLPFERMFNVLQSSVGQTNPSTYIKENLWDKMGWSEGAGMFIQMMMAAQHDGALSDGWLLRARLHVMEREYNRARSDEATWNAKRDNLGFSQYNFADTMDISENDWYLIAISYVTQRNYNKYFDMWAMPMTSKAREQVEALGYPVMKQQYFKSESQAYCYGLDQTAVPVDGKQSW